MGKSLFFSCLQDLGNSLNKKRVISDKRPHATAKNFQSFRCDKCILAVVQISRVSMRNFRKFATVDLKTYHYSAADFNQVTFDSVEIRAVMLLPLK